MSLRFMLAYYVFMIVLAAVIRAPEVSRAADPPAPQFPPQQNTDQFMYNNASLDRYNPFSEPLRQTGVWPWRFDRNPACAGNIEGYVRSALADLGGTYGINFVEDALNGHLIYQNCGPSLSARCGATNINCLGRGYPYDVTIDLSSDLATYFEVSSVSIVEHEMLHAMATYNEQYKLDGSFSPSQDVTVMNTGPLSRHYQQQADRERWNRTMGPLSLRIVGQGRNPDGRAFVYYCQPPERTNRVALLYDDGAGPYFAGRYAEPGTDSNGCRGVLVDERPGRVVLLKSESAVSWKTSFTEVVAGRF